LPHDNILDGSIHHNAANNSAKTANMDETLIVELCAVVVVVTNRTKKKKNRNRNQIKTTMRICEYINETRAYQQRRHWWWSMKARWAACCRRCRRPAPSLASFRRRRCRRSSLRSPPFEKRKTETKTENLYVLDPDVAYGVNLFQQSNHIKLAGDQEVFCFVFCFVFTSAGR
jgi:hypothetical protein